MSDDLITLRILAVFESAADRDLLRQGAGQCAVPIEIVEAGSAQDGCNKLTAGNVDLVFLDAAIDAQQRAGVIAAARPARRATFVILVGATHDSELSAGGATADGMVGKPTKLDEAKALLERCIRVRLPCRALVVDDSPTMRSIVRKILESSRFQFDLVDAQEGFEALQQIRSGKFDFVFLDYNMPGLNGIETLAEIKRQYPKLEVVMMTSTPDEALAMRARAAGAAAFLKKPFYPADIDAVLHGIYGLRTTKRPS